MKTTNNTNEAIQAATSQVLEMFRSQKFPAMVALTTIKRIKGDKKFPSDSYSFLNRLILAFHGAEVAMGYKAWQKDYGRYVKKGERAIKIFAPLTKNIKAEDSPDGKEHVLILGFRSIPVFDYKSTDGKPLDIMEHDYTPDKDKMPPFLDVAKALDIKVKWKPACRNAYGWYSPRDNEITLCSEDYITYFHELAHAIADYLDDLKCHDTAYNEIVAELSAAILCELNAIQGFHHQSYEYILEYSKDKTPKAVISAITSVLGSVENIVSLIIKTADELETKNAVQKGMR